MLLKRVWNSLKNIIAARFCVLKIGLFLFISKNGGIKIDFN